MWVAPTIVGLIGGIAVLVGVRRVADDAASLALSLQLFGEMRQPVLELRADALSLKADVLELQARPRGVATEPLPARPETPTAS